MLFFKLVWSSLAEIAAMGCKWVAAYSVVWYGKVAACSMVWYGTPL